MTNSGPALLWGINNETGRISALPASPLLLPAAIIYLIFRVVGVLWPKKIQAEPLPDNFDDEEYWRNKVLYNRLIAKQRSGATLTDAEVFQLRYVLARPSWAKPGEVWRY